MCLWEPKFTSVKELVFPEPKSHALCLVVAGCEAGDTILNDEMGCVGITGDNGEATAEGMYLHVKSLGVHTEVGIWGLYPRTVTFYSAAASCLFSTAVTSGILNLTFCVVVLLFLHVFCVLNKKIIVSDPRSVRPSVTCWYCLKTRQARILVFFTVKQMHPSSFFGGMQVSS